MSKLNPLYKKGDIKYFRKLHLERQQQMNQIPVSYNQFYLRLKGGMQLKEAIYTPCNTKMARYNMKPKKYKNLFYRFISLFK